MNLVLENKEYKSLDMFQKERVYNYKLYSSSKTSLKKTITSAFIVFETDPDDGHDDSLRYIEDIGEEIGKLHELNLDSLKFFEKRGRELMHIHMSWDNNRYRGTGWRTLEESGLEKYRDAFS